MNTPKPIEFSLPRMKKWLERRGTLQKAARVSAVYKQHGALVSRYAPVLMLELGPLRFDVLAPVAGFVSRIATGAVSFDSLIFCIEPTDPTERDDPVAEPSFARWGKDDLLVPSALGPVFLQERFLQRDIFADALVTIGGFQLRAEVRCDARWTYVKLYDCLLGGISPTGCSFRFDDDKWEISPTELCELLAGGTSTVELEEQRAGRIRGILQRDMAQSVEFALPGARQF